MKNDFKNIYFIGIGGIGMSAIARYLLANNYRVSGYDLVRNSNCLMLEKSGVEIHYEDNISLIDKSFLNNKETLIVYTPAIPVEHNELKYFRDKDFTIMKRAEILGLISKNNKSVCVAGTHGKTSISTLTAWIINNSQKKCTAFLGGISRNINSNLFLDTESKIMVLEADEFDRSFLNLNPTYSLVSIIESDHLDIYQNYDNLRKSFIDFINLTADSGAIVLNAKINKDILTQIKTKALIYTYSIADSKTDFFLSNVNYHKDSCTFDINHPYGIIQGVETKTGGNHNLENIVAAVSLSLLSGVSGTEIISAIQSFAGVKRRFEFIIKTDDLIFIDDYAHHPTEINACINAIKTLYPGRKVCGIFQPHLYSRTKDFAREFAESLSILDNLLLLPIYPAREKPIEGVSSQMIYDLCANPNKALIEKNEIINYIKSENPEILVTMGAGDIDMLIEAIKESLLNR